MRVAIPVFFNAPFGGLQDNVRASALALARSGWEVAVFCRQGPFADQLRTAHIQTFDLDNPPTTERFDIVHAHPGRSRKLGLKLAAESGCPFFITLHGRWIDAVQVYASRCEKIFTVSSSIGRLVKKQVGALRDRVVVLPNYVDTEVAAQPAKPLDRRKRKIDVIVASRLDADKGKLVDFLIECWQEQARRGLGTIHWQIAGGGDRLGDLEKAASQFGMGREAVTFHGWMDHAALGRLVDRCDVAVAPGRSAQEAMVRGKPVVAVGSGGNAGLVTVERFDAIAASNFGGFGTTASPSVDDTLDDLAKLAADGALRRNLGIALRALALHRFDAKVQEDRLIAFYRKALLKRGRKIAKPAEASSPAVHAELTRATVLHG